MSCKEFAHACEKKKKKKLDLLLLYDSGILGWRCAAAKQVGGIVRQ
jgi:hypothetical protein